MSILRDFPEYQFPVDIGPGRQTDIDTEFCSSHEDFMGHQHHQIHHEPRRPFWGDGVGRHIEGV